MGSEVDRRQTEHVGVKSEDAVHVIAASGNYNLISARKIETTNSRIICLLALSRCSDSGVKSKGKKDYFSDHSIIHTRRQPRSI
jgi:hypothetical protein